MTDILLESCQRFTPRRSLVEIRSSHPWLNDRCLRALHLKNSTVQGADARARVEECSAVFMQELRSYQDKCRRQLKEVKRGSKRWWHLCNIIMGKSQSSERIPALRDNRGWLFSPHEKAE
eukprot:9954457-Karenia_brevis.AAC.1